MPRSGFYLLNGLLFALNVGVFVALGKWWNAATAGFILGLIVAMAIHDAV